MDINWNLVKCALNKHTYGEPIKNETLQRVVKICVYCGKEVRLSDELLIETPKIYYKSMTEAESNRKCGQRIWYDPDGGYYITTPKKKQFWNITKRVQIMNIEKFISNCEEEKKKEDDLRELWKTLINEQKKYGSKYKPSYTGFFFNKKYICPNCKFDLIHKRIHTDGNTDIRIVDLLVCNRCDYKYAY